VAGAVELYEDASFEGDVAAEARDWLSGENEIWVRYYLLSAFVDRDEDEDTALILGYLDDEEPTLRAVATRYAADHLTPEIESHVASLYQNEPFWWIRTAILETLGSGEADTSLDLLHEALKDPLRDIRAAAVEALGERHDTRSVNPLVKALQWDDMVGADSPLGILGEIGGSDAAPRLEGAATSPYPVIRRMAALGLRETGSSDRAPILVELLTDPDETVQGAAARTLVDLGIARAAEDVLIYLTDHRDEELLGDLGSMKGLDAAKACRDLQAQGGLKDETFQTLSGMCDQLEEQLREGTRTVTISCRLGAGLGEYARFNPGARLVDPMGRARALGWGRVSGECNGGSPFRLERGTGCRSRRAPTPAARRTGDSLNEDVWVKENDLRPIGRREVLE
jgi:HEAT repeat protein